MQTYDIAIIGAGPAGIMAAIRAGKQGKNVALIERNNSIGNKILITGKGRCNLTNIASLDDFMKKFGRSGQFLRSAFTVFFNQELIKFFESKGLELKIERQGRVFPRTDSALSVIKALKECLSDNKVKVLYNTRVIAIGKESEYFKLEVESRSLIKANKIILATGGVSFKATGSTGDGFRIAKELGHIIVPLRPGLVALKAKEEWVKNLQGLALKNIRLTFVCDKKKIASEIGELLFTHFGASGPLILDLSNEITALLYENKEVRMLIDLKPGLTLEQLDNRLLRDFKVGGSKILKNLFKDLLPLRLIEVFKKLLNLDADKKANQVTAQERGAIVKLLKAFPLVINGALPIEEAMVTCGGVSLKEINPRTMESKLIPGLYFCGEIIDASAASGGYNLQQAFSTGFLAGESAANL